jgi:hypothetical protein
MMITSIHLQQPKGDVVIALVIVESLLKRIDKKIPRETESLRHLALSWVAKSGENRENGGVIRKRVAVNGPYNTNGAILPQATAQVV